MAEFRKGVALIKETAESKGGGGARKFTPNIYWKEGDIRTLAFVTPAEEIPKVKLHQMVRIPDDSLERGFKYETFLCRKDPSLLAESGGACILCDHIGHDATERFVALAMELEPVKTGKETTGFNVKVNKVKRDDGTEIDYPRWGLVIQGAKNFYAWLAAYDESKGDITKLGFEIHREGDSIGTKYHFFPEKGVPLPDNLAEVLEDVPTLENLLEEMGSDEKYAQLSEVEPGSQPSFGNSNKPSTSNTGAGATSRSRFDSIRQEVESYS